MIRRDMFDSAGEPVWGLISQVEHARLSAEMAAAWTGEVAQLPQTRDKFLAAVRHHDDGWIPWELRPTVHDGLPRDFMEMPLDESLAIWRRSIAVARTYGELAAYAVSAHFLGLCRHSYEEKPHDDAWRHLAEEFFEEQTDLQAGWRRDFAARGTPTNFAASNFDAADLDVSELHQAWHGLQFFDFLSLWLCCAERTAAETIAVPQFAKLHGAPLPTTGDGVRQIAITPWPFVGEVLEFAVHVRTIPRANLPTDEALAQALATAESSLLAWRLQRG